MKTRLNTTRTAAMIAGAASLGLLVAGCSGSSTAGSSETEGVTITVALMLPAPPQAALDEFTEETGITVIWSNIDWDSLQTKITAAATANTYFADATDVDWSRVGQLGQLDWFYPMEDYLDTETMAADMPQMSSFTSGGHVVGIPFDASFMVTTVNQDMFTQAGIDTMPTTIDAYTQDLQQIKDEGVAEYPLNIPFAAAEGLSTYWYQTTGAFGGSVLDGDGTPQFGTPDTAGYQAAQWMIDALQNGLVPPGNINVTDSQGQQTLVATGAAASTFSDYSGMIGSLYDVPESSEVVGQIRYLPTPGTSGVGPNLGNPDGIGIPRTAKYPEAAAEFIEWYTSAEKQADWAGANGPDQVQQNYPIPSRLSAVQELTTKGVLIGGTEIADMLANSAQPVFPEGAPVWYPEFSRAVYTSLHSAATGEMTVDQAIQAMVDTADKLASGS